MAGVGGYSSRVASSCCWLLPLLLWWDAVCVVEVRRRLRAAVGCPRRCAVCAGAYNDCLHGDVVDGYTHCLAGPEGGSVGYTAVALHGSKIHQKSQHIIMLVIDDRNS